jgi:hypothetical protein
VVVSDDVTVEEDGVFGGNVTAKSGDATYETTVGEVQGSSITSVVGGVKMVDWLMGVRPKQSPGVGSGNEWVLFYTRLSEFPVLRLIDDGANIILALNSTFTATRGVQLGEDATGKRFATINGLIVRAQTAYYEQGRADAVGHWVNVTHSAGNFTAPTGTWTVDSGDQTHFRYTLIGKTMTVAFVILNTDVSATPTSLEILIPGGFTAATGNRNCISTIDAGGTPQFGMVQTAAGDPKLRLYRDATGTLAWSTTAADNTSVAGQITFEVQ